MWRVGLGALFVLALAMVGMQSPYYPRLFGIGGGLILLSFFGILWFWARDRLTLRGKSTAPADFRLAGYVFLLMGTWFACGIGAAPFLEALEGRDPVNPIHIIGLLAMGWLSLFTSHYLARKQPYAMTESVSLPEEVAEELVPNVP